jgi:hypothetical protein
MKHGHFKAIGGSLVEVPAKPIKVKVNGEDFVIRPDNPFYETVLSYHKKFIELDPETEIEIDQEDRGVPSLSEL